MTVHLYLFAFILVLILNKLESIYSDAMERIAHDLQNLMPLSALNINPHL